MKVAKFAYIAFLALNSLSLMRMPSTLQVQGGCLSHGEFISGFRETKEGQCVLLAPAVSQVTLIQNNQYAKVASFGMAYSAPPHVLIYVSLFQII